MSSNGKRRPWLMAAAGAALIALVALGLAACGGGDSTGGDATSSASTEAVSGDSRETGKITPEDVKAALSYVGGTEEAADASLPPVKIGFVNNQGGAIGFPDQEMAADAAVKLVNEKLGGVQGHPVELAKCFIKAEEDGQKCASQLLNEGVEVANWGITVFGEESFLKLVNGKFPVLMSTSAFPFPNDQVFQYDGGSQAIINAIVNNTAQAGKKVAVIMGDNPPLRANASEFVVPGLKAEGISVKPIFVSDTATTPEYVSALQSSGAADSDALLLMVSTAGNCLSVYTAMQQLGLELPVFSTPQCSSEPVPAETGGGPTGFTVSSGQDIPLIDTPEQNTYNNTMEEYGYGEDANGGFTNRSFDDILTLVKIANEVGFDNLSAPELSKALKSFAGPAWGIPGELACGSDPSRPGLCGYSASNATYTGTEWEVLPPFEDPGLKP